MDQQYEVQKRGKKQLQGKSWFITLNGQHVWEEKFELAKMHCLYGIGQVEVGEENGREHLHMFVNFRTNQRLKAILKLWPGAHVEIPFDKEACIKYCSKEETRIRGPWSFGESPVDRQKKNFQYTVKQARKLNEEQLQDLSCQNYLVVKKALLLVQIEPVQTEKVRGVWLWGKPGAGKSYTARKDYPGAFFKDQSKYFDGYRGEKFIILDDLDAMDNRELGHNLKIWADRYYATAQVKFGYVNLAHEKFVVTSNYLPKDLWKDDELVEAINRRFEMIHIVKL